MAQHHLDEKERPKETDRETVCHNTNVQNDMNLSCHLLKWKARLELSSFCRDTNG